MELYLIRHGEDEDNARNLFNGRRNQKMTSRGELQAKVIADYFNKNSVVFDAVYTSPLQRARRTTNIIEAHSDQPQAVISGSLIERDVGSLSGLTVPEALKVYTGKLIFVKDKPYFVEPPGGETLDEARDRVAKFLQMLQKKHNKEKVCVVTHGMVIKIIYAVMYKLTWEQALSGIAVQNGDLLLMSEREPVKFLIKN